MKKNSYRDLIEKDGNDITISLPGALAATSTNYGVFFIANRPIEIMKVQISHTTAGTNAGEVTLQIEKLIGTDALDGGTELLKTAYDLKGTINTVNSYRGYNQLVRDRVLKEGERLALKDSGTLTDVAGVCVTIYYKYANNGDYAI